MAVLLASAKGIGGPLFLRGREQELEPATLHTTLPMGLCNTPAFGSPECFTAHGPLEAQSASRLTARVTSCSEPLRSTVRRLSVGPDLLQHLSQWSSSAPSRLATPAGQKSPPSEGLWGGKGGRGGRGVTLCPLAGNSASGKSCLETGGEPRRVRAASSTVVGAGPPPGLPPTAAQRLHLQCPPARRKLFEILLFCEPTRASHVYIADNAPRAS